MTQSKIARVLCGLGAFGMLTLQAEAGSVAEEDELAWLLLRVMVLFMVPIEELLWLGSRSESLRMFLASETKPVGMRPAASFIGSEFEWLNEGDGLFESVWSLKLFVDWPRRGIRLF